MSCHFLREDAWTHGDDDEVIEKKVSKLPIFILIPLSQKVFYVYQLKHDFIQIHNGWGKFWPSKTMTGQPSLFWMVFESREMFA
jgi:hypothetical protein